MGSIMRDIDGCEVHLCDYMDQVLLTVSQTHMSLSARRAAPLL